jgi:hypothetical protein
VAPARSRGPASLSRRESQVSWRPGVCRSRLAPEPPSGAS